VAFVSDVDWIILAGAAVFLLFGRNAGTTFRTFGRWYGKLVRFKADMIAEVSRAAELPLPALGQPVSFRATLLGLGEPESRAMWIPAAVAPPVSAVPGPQLSGVASTSYPVGPTWSFAVPSVVKEPEGPS